ncbi:MAG: DinB family protein [Ferruginibacter sp.]
MSKPSPTGNPGYFKIYTDQVVETDLATAFQNQSAGFEEFLNRISEEKSLYAYADGKWTIKEMLQHIIDAERIFAYRAVCFARGEAINLPGFEENDYAANSHANERSWKSIVEEFIINRRSIELMFASFTNEVLALSGTANNNTTSVESIGFIIVGHFNHHKKVLLERYL